MVPPASSPLHSGILLVATALLCLLAIIAYVKPWWSKSKTLSLPPGPRPLPLIGNLLDMPRLQPWSKFREYALQYGENLAVQTRPRDSF